MLFAVPAAQAKAPPDVRICGASGCAAIAQSDAERLPLWSTSGATAPGAPAPFYVLQYRWKTTDPYETVYWIPSRNLVRFTSEALVSWYRVPRRAFEPFALGLAPIPVPKITAVTVGRRAVRAPSSYLKVFSAGRATNEWPGVSGWLRVRFTASAASPWTDARADVRVSNTASYLLRDDTVFVIPKRLADRIRHRLPLTG